MSILKILAYLSAAILIFFGVLFIWGAFSPQGQLGWILVGLLGVGMGFGLIWLAGRRKPAGEQGNEVTYKIDLPGDVSLDKLTCQSCGGVLTSKNIKIVSGAPVVDCPYCGTTYQLSEAPKW